MKKLTCTMLGGDYVLDKYQGQVVTVTHVASDMVTLMVLAEDGKTLKCWIDQIMPTLEFLAMVPASHCASDNLRRIWLIGEARNDAWFREKPQDLARYEAAAGVPWVDNRVFDVQKRHY